MFMIQAFADRQQHKRLQLDTNLSLLDEAMSQMLWALTIQRQML